MTCINTSPSNEMLLERIGWVNATIKESSSNHNGNSQAKLYQKSRSSPSVCFQSCFEEDKKEIVTMMNITLLLYISS